MRCHLCLRVWEAWRNSPILFLHSVVGAVAEGIALCPSPASQRDPLPQNNRDAVCGSWLALGGREELSPEAGGESFLVFFILGKIHTLMY